MVWLLNSQGMKNCKSTESFCPSIPTIYTNDRSPFWHVYCYHICFFFLHVISSLFSHFCLFQNAILKFSQNLVFIGCNIFFRLALVICLSWYLYLTLSHEFLTFTSFNIWRLKCESIRFSQLELLTWHFGAKCSFQTFKRPLSDWFGPKCKCKLSS